MYKHIYAHTHEHIQINHTIQLSLTGPQSCGEAPCKGLGVLHPGPTTVLDRASILWRSPLQRPSSSSSTNGAQEVVFSVEPKWSERDYLVVTMGTSHSPPWIKHLSYWIWCFGLLCVCAHIASGSRVVVVVAKGNEMCWAWPNCIDHFTHAIISSKVKKKITLTSYKSTPQRRRESCLLCCTQ